MTSRSSLSMREPAQHGVTPGRAARAHGRNLLADPAGRPGISGVAYDTAWLAGVPNREDRRKSRFPATLRWLASNQHADGSWGSSIRYEHDRILCTLAALAPLAEFGHRAEDHHAVERGTRYLWQHGHLISREPVELVGFELLLPSLVERARKAGVAVPPHLDVYATQRSAKLKILPTEMLYSPRATVVHSLEFLGDNADIASLKGAQGQNGAIGNSPAATAFFLNRTQEENPSALDYLESVLDHAGGATAPVLHPCETFELLWAAYHLFLGGAATQSLLQPEERRQLRHALRHKGGVSLSPTFPIPDADDTAVALLLLYDLGESVDPSVLNAFAASDGSFVSFPYERHSSVGVNAHVLHALARVPGYPDADRAIARICDYLADQHSGLFWIDKWHISPLYATAHVLRTLADLPLHHRRRLANHVERSREWLRQSQNTDGSWGFYGQSTPEETAYGLLALTLSADDRDMRHCEAAAEYLNGASSDRASHPPLWVDKCLYIPPLVVNAAIDAALRAWNLRNLDNRS
jgi:halimadienyl-diphosphate synthase